MRTLVVASLVTPPFVGAVAWEMLAAPNSGLLNQLWRDLTGAEDPLFDIYTMEGLIFVMACYTFPYVFILVANALDRMPGELEDASSMLGSRGPPVSADWFDSGTGVPSGRKASTRNSFGRLRLGSRLKNCRGNPGRWRTASTARSRVRGPGG